MNVTMMKSLNDMSITQLNDTKAMIDTLIKQKVRSEMTVGTKVNVVQKTKKTPGTIRKINKTRAIVDMVTNPISGAVSGYNVPFSMLEAA